MSLLKGALSRDFIARAVENARERYAEGRSRAIRDHVSNAMKGAVSDVGGKAVIDADAFNNAMYGAVPGIDDIKSPFTRASRSYGLLSGANDAFMDTDLFKTPSPSDPNWSGSISRAKKEFFSPPSSSSAQAAGSGLLGKFKSLSPKQRWALGGGAALGALGLGAGGYALYKHLKNKSQESAEKSASDQGYDDALEKLGLRLPGFLTRGASAVKGVFSRAPKANLPAGMHAPVKGIKPMQEFSYSGVDMHPTSAPRAPGAGPSAIDQVRADFGAGGTGAPTAAGPSRIQQFEQRMSSPPPRNLVQEAQSAGVKGAPTFGEGIAPSVGEAAAPVAQSGGLLSSLGNLSPTQKLLGGAALVGGGAYLYNKHRQSQEQQEMNPQQFYGPPQQMPQPGYGYGY